MWTVAMVVEMLMGSWLSGLLGYRWATAGEGATGAQQCNHIWRHEHLSLRSYQLNPRLG